MAPTMFRFPLQARPPLVAHLGAIVILCLGGWQIWRARESALIAAQTETVTLSRSLTQHAARSIEAADLILSGVVDRIETGTLTDPVRFKRFLEWRLTSLPQVRGLVVVDANGNWISDSIEQPHAPINTADRDYFAWHRDHADRTLHFGPPVESRYNGKPIIPLSRRWNKPDGSFGGVVFAALAPEYFEAFYGTLGMGREGTINLLGLSGRVMARHPILAGVTGRDVSASPLFREKLPTASAGSYLSRSVIDGMDRVAAYGRVDPFPLVVYVGRGVADTLAPWRRDALVEGLALCLAAGGLSALGFGMGRHQTRIAMAETTVRESEARYRLLAETTTDVITRLNLDFKRVYISPTCLRLFGYEPAEMLGNQPSTTIHPEDAAAVRELARGLVVGEVAGERATATYRTRHKLGHWVWIEAGMSLVRDDSGRPDSIVCSLRDATQRKEAEAALGASERRYRLLSENASDMVTQMDAMGRRLYVSPASRDLLGYEPEELVGTRPLNTIHPEDHSSHTALLDAMTEGRCARGVHVCRLRHRNGTWVWVEASLKALRDAEGRFDGFVASVRDITDRKSADEARQVSEARYRMLADNTSDVIMLRERNPEGGRSYVSPAVRSMLGYEPNEFAAIPIPEIIHPDDLDRVITLYATLGPTLPSVVSVHRLRHKDGSYVWVEIVFRLVTDPADGKVRVLGAIRDVTERQRQARHLEQAKAAAEAGARIKTEFLANMSHELRTPLTGMLGVHDLLRSDPTLSQSQLHLVGLAQESGLSLLTIVNDILDFSKIEAGQLTIERIPFALRALVEGCRGLAAEAARGKSLVVAIAVQDDVPDFLMGDPTRVRQVLLNLVTNAVKFTPAGTVTIGVGRASDRSDQIRIAVTDTGIGIAPHVQSRLFERFSQADGSTARSFGGTGLGLAISRRLVELMGGEIGLVSAPGTGSTFWFTLPLTAAQPQGALRTPHDIFGTTLSRPLRILVAEDNTINQEIITAVLHRKGHHVTLAGNGHEAVAAVHSGPAFDVILMDIQMPELDGLSATAAIREMERAERRRATPIVALTANALAEEVERCRTAGVDAHVGKPIDWRVLGTTIDQLTEPSASPTNASATFYAAAM